MPTLLSSTNAYAVITNGINAPKAEVFDGSGDLFVANSGSNQVTEYAPPYAGGPAAAFTGVAAPDLLTTDSNGDVAVAGSTGTTLHVYLHGAFGSPVSATLPAKPSALAFDSQNRLWILYPTLNAAGRYPGGGATPYQVLDQAAGTSMNAPSAMVLDYKNGAGQSDNLYVINSGGDQLHGALGVRALRTFSICRSCCRATCSSTLCRTRFPRWPSIKTATSMPPIQTTFRSISTLETRVGCLSPSWLRRPRSACPT